MPQTPHDSEEAPPADGAISPSAQEPDDALLSDEELDKVSGGMAAEISPKGRPRLGDPLL